MRNLAILVAGAAAAVAVSAASGTAVRTVREDPEFLYNLNCSGCHKPDGSGNGRFVPRLKGEIGGILGKAGGRQYLIQVPGVSQSSLTDGQIASVMNWAVLHFDAKNVPPDFHPYTEAEVHTLRKSPLSDATRVRASLFTGS